MNSGWLVFWFVLNLVAACANIFVGQWYLLPVNLGAAALLLVVMQKT